MLTIESSDTVITEEFPFRGSLSSKSTASHPFQLKIDAGEIVSKSHTIELLAATQIIFKEPKTEVTLLDTGTNKNQINGIATFSRVSPPQKPPIKAYYKVKVHVFAFVSESFARKAPSDLPAGQQLVSLKKIKIPLKKEYCIDQLFEFSELLSILEDNGCEYEFAGVESVSTEIDRQSVSLYLDHNTGRLHGSGRFRLNIRYPKMLISSHFSPSRRMIMQNPFETNWEFSDILTAEAIAYAEKPVVLNKNRSENSSREAASLGQGGFGRIDDHSGASVYRVPIYAVPPRGAGPSPSVALTYNSLSNQVSGLAGAGWRMELGCIERRSSGSESVLKFTDNQGQSTCNEQFDLQLDGASYTLVKVAGENNTFAAKKEEFFLQAIRVGNGEKDTESSESGEIFTGWIVFTSNGQRYLYGYVPGEGLDFGEENAPVIKNKRWSLVKVENVYGHGIAYDYELYKNPEQPFHQEVDYPYPVRIRTGVTPSGQHDGEILFDYVKPIEHRLPEGELPDAEEGYQNLGIGFTGRSGFTAIYWRRLARISTRALVSPKTFQNVRSMKFLTELHDFTAHRVREIEELGYDQDGNVDESTKQPEHQFFYISNESNIALLAESVNPLGLSRKYTYGRATDKEVDTGNPVGISEDSYLIIAAAECIKGEDPWVKTYSYKDGLNYRSFGEYRGHAEVTVTDKSTGHVTVSEYHQTGLLNRCLKHRRKFITVVDDQGKKIDEHLLEAEDHTWVVLDYKGGRYLPVQLKSTKSFFLEDGKTVLRSRVSEVLKKTEKEFAFDSIGYPLNRRETVFSGPVDVGKLVQEVELHTNYEHRFGDAKAFDRVGQFRFFGLKRDENAFITESHGTQGKLSNSKSSHFNAQGQVDEEFRQLTVAGEGIRNFMTYDLDTGQPLETYREEGGAKVLQTRTEYHTVDHEIFHFLPKISFNALGHATEILGIDMRWRIATQVLDPNGVQTVIEFDGLGRSVKEEIVPSGTTEGTLKIHRYKIDSDVRYVETEDLRTGTYRREEVDELGRNIRNVISGFEGEKVIESEIIEFDHATRQPSKVAAPRFKVADPGFEGEDPISITEIEYNDPFQLRKTLQRTSDGGKTRYDYGGHTTTVTEEILWQDAGESNLTAKRKRLVQRTIMDAAGRLISEARGDHPDDNKKVYEITHSYDELGRRIASIDNLGRTLITNEYGNRIDKLVEKNTDRCRGTNTFQYDSLGRLVRQVKDHHHQQDLVVTSAYDLLDRLINQTLICRISDDESSQRVRRITNEYDGALFGLGKLNLQTVSDSGPLGHYSISDDLQYDVSGSLSQKGREISFQNNDELVQKASQNSSFPSSLQHKLITQYANDIPKGGRLVSITTSVANQDALSESVKYSYDDPSGQIVGIANEKNTDQALWKVLAKGIDARGQLLGCELGNETVCHYTYDPLTGRRLTSKQQYKGLDLLNEKIEYDTSGNVVGRFWSRLTETGNRSVINETFLYNALNCLLQIKDADQGDADATHTFGYHTDGMRSYVHSPEGKFEYFYDDEDRPFRLTQVENGMDRTFNYLSSGCISIDNHHTDNATRRIEWSLIEKPESLQIAKNGNSEADEQHIALCFGYSADGERAFKWIADTRELETYLGAQSTARIQLDQPGATQLFCHATMGQRRIATVTLNSSLNSQAPQTPHKFYIRDYLGSVRLVLDPQGITDGFDYDAFGLESPDSEETECEISFTGHRRDLGQSCGFSQQDFNARYYDPELGIFLGPDPSDDVANIAFGFHRYAYVGQNAVSLTDPTGLRMFFEGAEDGPWKDPMASAGSGEPVAPLVSGDPDWVYTKVRKPDANIGVKGLRFRDEKQLLNPVDNGDSSLMEPVLGITADATSGGVEAGIKSPSTTPSGALFGVGAHVAANGPKARGIVGLGKDDGELTAGLTAVVSPIATLEVGVSGRLTGFEGEIAVEAGPQIGLGWSSGGDGVKVTLPFVTVRADFGITRDVRDWHRKAWGDKVLPKSLGDMIFGTD